MWSRRHWDKLCALRRLEPTSRASRFNTREKLTYLYTLLYRLSATTGDNTAKRQNKQRKNASRETTNEKEKKKRKEENKKKKTRKGSYGHRSRDVVRLSTFLVPPIDHEPDVFITYRRWGQSLRYNVAHPECGLKGSANSPCFDFIINLPSDMI